MKAIFYILLFTGTVFCGHARTNGVNNLTASGTGVNRLRLSYAVNKIIMGRLA